MIPKRATNIQHNGRKNKRIQVLQWSSQSPGLVLIETRHQEFTGTKMLNSMNWSNIVNKSRLKFLHKNKTNEVKKRLTTESSWCKRWWNVSRTDMHLFIQCRRLTCNLISTTIWRSFIQKYLKMTSAFCNKVVFKPEAANQVKPKWTIWAYLKKSG